jgi:uncharacterized protein YecA (UPF0149 family)
MPRSKAAPAKRGEEVASEEAPTGHVHGPDCHHDHAGDHHHGDFATPYRRDTPKLGRNDPCHCGSGRKYKKCHGAQG